MSLLYFLTRSSISNYEYRRQFFQTEAMRKFPKPGRPSDEQHSKLHQNCSHIAFSIGNQPMFY